MKRNFSLVISAILFTLQCTAQTLNANGKPTLKINTNVNAPYQNVTTFSPFLYDSVRILSEINIVGAADAFPWISADGLRLYYFSEIFNNVVFTSRLNTSSYFDSPALANPVFPPGTRSCWFSSDELDVYYIDGLSLYYAHRITISSVFNTPVLITINGGIPFSAPSLDPTQNELYFYGTYYISRYVRTSPISFDFTYPLLSPIGVFDPGQLSKDGLVFFTGIESNGKTSIYSLTRPSLTDSLTNPQYIQGINDSNHQYNGQPTMSDNLEWVVMVGAVGNSWPEDELYLANKGTITSVFNPSKENFKVTVYPNPVSNKLYFHISKAIEKKQMIQIYSAQNSFVEGKFIDNNETLNVSNYDNGFYFYKISNAANTFLYNGKFVVMH